MKKAVEMRERGQKIRMIIEEEERRLRGVEEMMGREEGGREALEKEMEERFKEID